MKKISYLFIFSIILLSCKKEGDYATFSGKIINKNSDSLVVSDAETNFSKAIKVDENGEFSGELQIENGLYSVSDGTEYSLIYLQKGDNLSVDVNAKDFLNSITFSGTHADENNFLAKSVVNEEGLLMDPNLMNLPKANFDLRIKNYIDEFNSRLDNKNLSSEFIVSQKSEIEDLSNYYRLKYEEINYLTLKLGKGVPSPKFDNYENYDGNTTSLDDLKGKYVYIDLWATWCPPCKAEIPYLQKIEKDFHNKDIAFVSISLDAAKDYNTWKKMVSDKELTGIQLYAKEDKSFTTAYQVKSIPRFILIDKQGNIVDADAPRPSKPELVELFRSLDI